MKRSILALAFAILLPAAGFCGGDLDVFIDNMNVEARADLGAFKARMSTGFGVPMEQVEVVLGGVRTPGDAYMVFRAGQVAGRPHAVVLEEYRAHQGQGWGVMAKNLGIKPGSAEFHALKKGWGDGASGPGSGKKGKAGKGKKGKGGKKDKGKGRG